MRLHQLKYFLLFSLILNTLQLFATHNRAGEITYQHIEGSNFKYEFTITTYTDPASPADRDALVIFWGDGEENFDTLYRDSEEVITDDIKKNTYHGIHEYAAPGTYKVYMQDPNRVEGILNMDGSVNVPFYLETWIYIVNPLTLGYDSSPILTNPPIDYANIGEIFTHNPGAYDPDGDALRFSLIPPRQDPNNDVPGYQYPDEYTSCDDIFSIDSLTGDIVWDVPCDEGIFVIAIRIVSLRGTDTMSIVNRDMQIEVLDNPNNAPVITEINDTCIFAGEELVLLVTASDEDITQELTLSATGGPFVVASSPADFFSDPADGFVSGTFSWETNCSHVRNEFYTVVFKVEDDYSLGSNEFHLTDQESWLITVIAPPVENVVATAQANAIKVTWNEPYICAETENFLGFTIWRRLGCDTVEFDKCQRGLDGFGYDSIAFIEDAYEYIDNTVSHGQIYSYRILAEFGERSDIAEEFVYNRTQSFPSNNSCAELKRDVPIINHVSVTTTDIASGTMFIQWYPPLAEDVDTLQNPGPYQYILKRFENRDAEGTGLEIASFTSPTFAGLTDTVFDDTGLNTLEKQYSYIIDFYTLDGLLGTSNSASSVFLNSIPADNKVILSWDFNVPWDNYLFVVYKEIPTGSGNFLAIDTTLDQFYTDDSLANGTEVCYKIESIGQYTASSLPADILINFSQIKCETPIDVEAPCAPVLTISNVCESDEIVIDVSELKNDLSWTNPNNSCAEDVIKYYIYYSPTFNEPLLLLDSIVTGAEDTMYSHVNLQSLAGCYAVVAVDSFNNASQQSAIVCVDNCSNYNLPNVFTPNADGANDLYTPILPYLFIDHVDMQIFNRWGGLVFKTSDPMLNWDGKDINTGKELKEGVYYYSCILYTVTVNGVVQDPVPLKGYIHLIRSERSQ
ncbi:MAG: gliding motility-associated C-terminal domain-containing protein [Chitinophagales bacterium]